NSGENPFNAVFVATGVRPHNAAAIKASRVPCGEDTLLCRAVIDRPYSCERNVIVFTNSLQYKEGCRSIARIGDEMRTPWSNGIDFTWTERHLLLRLLEKQPDASVNYVERILNIVVVMPGHRLGRRNLQF